MKINVIQSDETLTHIAIEGQLDQKIANGLEQEFLSIATKQATHVLIDFSDVTFITSVGIRVLLTAARSLDKHGKKIAIYHPIVLVKDILDMAKLNAVFVIEDDKETALKKLP